ncbi:hypothetical protein HOF92_00930 [bacterium]|jgi:hypothetical protein|nr:hypothetical protein [bacterium]
MLTQIKGWAECLGGHEKTFQKSNEGTSTRTFQKGITRLNDAYGSVLKMVKNVYPPLGNTRFANFDFAKSVGKLEGPGSVSVRRDLAAHLVDKISASKGVRRGASTGHIKYHRTDDLIQMIKGDDGSLAIIESEMNASIGIKIPAMWEAILFNTCRAKGKDYVYGNFSPYGDCPKHDPKEAHKVVGEIIGHISKSAGENASKGDPKVMKAQAYFLGKIVGHMEKGFLAAKEKLAKTEREKIAFGFNIVKYSLKVVRQFTPAAAHSALDRVQEAADKLYKYELNQEKIDKKELRNLMELVFKAVNIGFHSALQGDSFESRMTGSYEFQSSLEEGRGSSTR